MSNNKFEFVEMCEEVMLSDLYILLTTVFCGFYYYKASISKETSLRRAAFLTKICLLIMSFILAFIEKDSIMIGETIFFGGRTSVMIIVLIEIADAFIEVNKNKEKVDYVRRGHKKIISKGQKQMDSTKNKELYETIQYHIDNKMLINIERIFNGATDIIHGFPLMISDELLFMTVINDFHDEGFAILRLKDMSDAYSKENEAFCEQICISENIGIETSEIIKDITDISVVLKQLLQYKGFISIQCENQIERCTFYLGEICTVEDDGVIFKDVGIDGVWDDESHKILFEEITQITYGDNYSKMFYKYVDEK